jgi:hypothetical protein
VEGEGKEEGKKGKREGRKEEGRRREKKREGVPADSLKERRSMINS